MPRTSLKYPSKTLFSCEISLRISDINYGQHLAHDKLISILHEARSQFFHHFGVTESNIEGLGIILSELAIHYQAEAFYPDTLKVKMAIGKYSRCGFEMFYQAANKAGTVIATAKTDLVFFNYQDKKVASIPASFKHKLTPSSEPEP